MIRSMLFLPGNNPNMLANGDVLGADAIIFDIEDAVSMDEKDSARILVRNTLESRDYSKIKVLIRINPVDDNDFWEKDLEEIVPLAPDYIMPPKVSGKDYIKTLVKKLEKLEKRHKIEEGTIKLIPLLETAVGIENAYKIATSSERIKGLFLGGEDLTADLGCPRTKEGNEILYARGRIIMAAKAAGISVYDTPFVDINDDEGLVKDTMFAKSMGFTGKVAISPRHVGVINSIFSPTQKEIDYACEVLEAIEEAKRQGKGAIALYGKMIDAPIVARAEQTLEIARQIGLS